jgi:hypothetical protein
MIRHVVMEDLERNFPTYSDTRTQIIDNLEDQYEFGIQITLELSVDGMVKKNGTECGEWTVIYSQNLWVQCG